MCPLAWTCARLSGEEEPGGTRDLLPTDSLIEQPTSCVSCSCALQCVLVGGCAPRLHRHLWCATMSVCGVAGARSWGSPPAPALARIISTLSSSSAERLGLTSTTFAGRRPWGKMGWVMCPSSADCQQTVRESSPRYSFMGESRSQTSPSSGSSTRPNCV